MGMQGVILPLLAGPPTKANNFEYLYFYFFLNQFWKSNHKMIYSSGSSAHSCDLENIR